VGVTAVKQDRLFDQTLADNLRKEIDIFLGGTRTHCDVVNARYGIIHRLVS
jgi:hypothetical protein